MKNNIYLGVNIDHIATLRQARGTRYPDPVEAVLIAEKAGADSITLHLREDRRHVQERDVEMIKAVMETPMNLEMALTDEMLAFAEKIQPQHCCLVPEKRQELTTEGGLDVIGQEEKIRAACQRLQAKGIEVSLFIDPDKKQLDASQRCGALAVEIHTGSYADALDEKERQLELTKIIAAAQYAKQLDFIVNAGHGLHYHNVQAIAAIPEFLVLNIGHSIIARAVMTGMHEAVATMKRLMLEARTSYS